MYENFESILMSCLRLPIDFWLLFGRVCSNVWSWVLWTKVFILSKLLSKLKFLRTGIVFKDSILVEVLKNSSFLLEFFHFLSADYSKCKENLSQTVNFYLLVD